MTRPPIEEIVGYVFFSETTRDLAAYALSLETQLAEERKRAEALLHAVQAHNDSPLELIDEDIAEATLAIREAIKDMALVARRLADGEG